MLLASEPKVPEITWWKLNNSENYGCVKHNINYKPTARNSMDCCTEVRLARAWTQARHCGLSSQLHRVFPKVRRILVAKVYN